MDTTGQGPTHGGQASDSDADSLHKSQGSDQIQALIFNLLAYPAPFFSRYNSLSRMNISEYLGLTLAQVSQVFDSPAFIDELYREGLAALHLHRSAVDEALIATAKWQGPKGAADRKLYYQMIGAIEGKIKKPESKKTSDLSREEKENVIFAYFQRFGKHLKSRGTLKDAATLADRQPSGQSGNSTGQEAP